MAKKHPNNHSGARGNSSNQAASRTSPNHPAMRGEKDNVMQLEGVVVDVFPGARFKVKLDTNGLEVLTHISGKMRMNSIRILPGDKVTVEVTTYDLRKGRIIFRAK